jgi:hypothetical protein
VDILQVSLDNIVLSGLETLLMISLSNRNMRTTLLPYNKRKGHMLYLQFKMLIAVADQSIFLIEVLHSAI